MDLFEKITAAMKPTPVEFAALIEGARGRFAQAGRDLIHAIDFGERRGVVQMRRQAVRDAGALIERLEELRAGATGPRARRQRGKRP